MNKISFTALITKYGKITVPKPARVALDICAGDLIEFEIIRKVGQKLVKANGVS